MELKRFIAENSQEALQQVKQQHGDDALIISTTKVEKQGDMYYRRISQQRKNGS